FLASICGGPAMHSHRLNRRSFTAGAAAVAAGAVAGKAAAAQMPALKLNYIVSSAMYGTMPLAEILPEVPQTGATHLDVWRKPHGDQREQIDELGADRVADMLAEYKVQLGVITSYPFGPFRLADEFTMARRLGAKVIVCGCRGPKEPVGAEAKAGVKAFLEEMKPHAEAAAESGVTIALENHDQQLLYTPDSLRYFAELNRSPNLGIALAPHHLHKFVDEIPALIEDLGAAQLPFLYAQEHGRGIREKLPKELEMMQLPGYGGGLDYRPILAALRKIHFDGFFEIFMHPTPRGIPILPTAGEVTAAINKSREYIEDCLREINA
ncbi:MAG: sugar phosphate isomerase/epimerase, partial [Planctomycetales bacterium]|nr:sugar phosphate isomerase/epimerase [Planctomycetales bacterium]